MRKTEKQRAEDLYNFLCEQFGVAIERENIQSKDSFVRYRDLGFPLDPSEEDSELLGYRIYLVENDINPEIRLSYARTPKIYVSVLIISIQERGYRFENLNLHGSKDDIKPDWLAISAVIQASMGIM